MATGLVVHPLANLVMPPQNMAELFRRSTGRHRVPMLVFVLWWATFPVSGVQFSSTSPEFQEFVYGLTVASQVAAVISALAGRWIVPTISDAALAQSRR
jgi:hypothetical protein